MEHNSREHKGGRRREGGEKRGGKKGNDHENTGNKSQFEVEILTPLKGGKKKKKSKNQKISTRAKDPQKHDKPIRMVRGARRWQSEMQS